MATKLIETQTTRPKTKTRKSKGVKHPWEVYGIFYDEYHEFTTNFKTKKEAERYIKVHPGLVCPVIVHINIPKIEY